MLERFPATCVKAPLEESPVHRRAPWERLRVQHLAQGYLGSALRVSSTPPLPQQLPSFILTDQD